MTGDDATADFSRMGDDWLDGEDGDDTLWGGSADETLTGLGGNDGLFVDAGADLLEGGEGSNLLLGGTGADTINGGNGADFIYDSAVGGITRPYSTNGIELGRGFGWVTYRASGSRIQGNSFTLFDVQVAEASTVVAYDDGQGGTLIETAGNIIDRGAGNDYIAASTGADIVHGGTEEDDIESMDDGDVLFGEAGLDIISGGALVNRNPSGMDRGLRREKGQTCWA